MSYMDNQKSNQIERKEEGFILVTSIVLIAILTILGAVSFFKTSVEIKVSKVSGDTAKAFSVANAGLIKSFVEWGTSGTYATEWTNDPNPSILKDIRDGVNNVAIYNPTLDPASMTDLRADATAAGATVNSCSSGTADVLDNYICWADGTGTNPLLRVYELQGAAINVVANNSWGSGNNAQVAVWVTGFDAPVNNYPYDSSNAGAACSTCRVVTYALGRSGLSKRLVRETQSAVTSKLTGVSAMTNAPQYDDFQDACSDLVSDGTPSASGVKVPVGFQAKNVAPDGTTDGNTYENTVINSTQSPYLRGVNDASSAPSGTAIISNTKLGAGSKGFRNGNSSATGASFEYTPMIIYAGHGAAATDNEVRVHYANTAVDNTATYDNLPAGELPHRLVRAPLTGDDRLKFFGGADAQLFSLDAYRWAAEQFTCQDSTAADGTGGNGRYCSKAEDLRQAMEVLDANATVPITGRLTMAEFEHNSNYGIPMFGMVRVMVPTALDAILTCSGSGANVQSYKVSSNQTVDVASLTTNAGGGVYNTTGPGGLDDDGALDDTARTVVYGSLLFDYFTDMGDTAVDRYGSGTFGNPVDDTGNDLEENNGVFDPAAGERLLQPLEAAESYMKIEFPILINPAMPRGIDTTDSAFPTAADLNGNGINDDVIATAGGAIINLASPAGGLFPATEGRLKMTGSGTYINGLAGTMRLMNNTVALSGSAVGLVSLSKTLEATPATFPPANAAALYSTHSVGLNYYYDLMVTNTTQSDANVWPMAAFPATLSSGHGFYIGAEDQAAGGNDADAFHLLFPSGYMHGWKVALAALDMLAGDWNNLLTGISSGVDLSGQHSPHLNFGDVAMLKGSPFNTVSDAGFADAAILEAAQSDYFKTEAGAGGYPLLSEEWADIPAEMYVGGLLDMHAHANINGVVYTPGPLEWEPGNSSYGGNSDHFAYISGSIITGFGAYVKNKYTPEPRYVLVYSNDTVDNINTGTTTTIMQRYAWQELK